VLTAPVAGTVTALNVGGGAYLNDPTAALMTIAGLDPVWITAQVPEYQLAGIAPGQAVDVMLAAYPGQTLHGRVGKVSPVLEADTRRAKVRIVFANADGRLKPNMFATVWFMAPQAAAVTAPTSALLMNNDSTTVFVEVAPWTFVRRVVEPGSEDRDSVRILSGLKPGERIVTRGGILLND
jgi:cobalt-zinc-cadmium efflux system membrane fusion protein